MSYQQAAEEMHRRWKLPRRLLLRRQINKARKTAKTEWTHTIITRAQALERARQDGYTLRPEPRSPDPYA